MRKGWDDDELSAPDVARRVEDAGASAITIHGRTAKQSYSGLADWEFVARIADALTIPVFGSGDCVEPEQIVERLRQGVSGVFVGRGVLRNPWILAQAQDLLAGGRPAQMSLEERGRFLLDYIELLQARAGPRARRLPPRRAGRVAGRRRRPRLAPRPLGRQQAARAVLVVHEGPRGRVAAANRREHRRCPSRSSRALIEDFFLGCARRRRCRRRTRRVKQLAGPSNISLACQSSLLEWRVPASGPAAAFIDGRAAGRAPARRTG